MSDKTWYTFIKLYLIRVMGYNITFWEFEVTYFACLNHNNHLLSISKRFLYLIDLVKIVLYIT